jgi:uncharacterized membrane protein YagU involved in acid resistance
MGSRIAAGVIAGLAAGVPFGVMMHVMSAPTPDGAEMPMMAMVALVVGSSSVTIGWLYHLFNSVVIGALFAGVLGARVHSLGSGLGLGAAWGVVWWVVGALVLMPLALGMPSFGPLMMEPMRPVAMGSLVGHLVFGLVLGGVYAALIRVRDARPIHA